MEPERKKKLPEPPVSKAKERAPGPKPGVVGRPELAQAGGYAEQRDRLKPSERAAGTAGAAQAGFAGVAPAGQLDEDKGAASLSKFPRKARILSMEAAVMAKPQFMGVRVAMLKRGEEVTLTGAQGAWYECITPEGAKGFIHKSRVDKKEIRLRSGETGSGTDRGNEPAAQESVAPRA